MRKTVLALALLALLGAAQARFYLGFPASGILSSGAIGTIGGLHFGTYNLYDDFGVRATAELGLIPTILVDPAVPVALIVEGGVDGTYSFGEGVVCFTLARGWVTAARGASVAPS